jgi:hypothetical protein
MALCVKIYLELLQEIGLATPIFLYNFFNVMGIFVWPHGKKNQVLDNLKIDMLDFHGFSISMVMSFQALLY